MPVKKLVILTLLLLTFVLVPFFLYEAEFERLADRVLALRDQPGLVAGLIASLLALDIFLPIPSSVVSAAAGAILGFLPATLTIWTGMTAGCLLGYGFGARAGRLGAGTLLRPDELEKMSSASAKYGPWLVVLFRPVPVFAEISVLYAGLTRMSWKPFALLAGGANLGIALVYAAAGAWSANWSSFLPAFFASMAIPLIGFLFTKRFSKKKLL